MTKTIFADPKELARGAAEYFVARRPETVALSGGSTPKLMFQILADQFRDQVAWSGIQFFWSDERHVPPDDPESNYRMANEALLAHVPVSAENVHRIYGENPNAADAARAQIVKEVLEGENEYPAKAVKPIEGELIWMLDKEAAAYLSK